MYINPDEDRRAETSNAGVGVQVCFRLTLELAQGL